MGERGLAIRTLVRPSGVVVVFEELFE